MFNIRASERGQAIIFLVLGLTAFLGFVALAIDGGMAYSTRREAQNLSDTAALAAAGLASLELENRQVYYSLWNCNSANIQAAMQIGRTTAINRAAANGFVIDEDISDHNGVIAVCGQDTSHGFTDKWIDFTVQISDTTTTSFIQLFMPSAIQVRTEAVTRIRPRMPLAFGNAIVALNPAECSGNSNGITFKGGAYLSVNDAGIWSNGCLNGGGSATVIVTGGAINYVGELTGDDGMDPAPTKASDPIPPSSYFIEPPDCSDPAAHNVSGSELPDILEPGLYCITGSLSKASYIGNGVTLYLLDGGLTFNGNVEPQLSAPSYDPDPSPAIPGILIYMPPGNRSTVRINGTADLYLRGTILAPDASFELSGTGWANSTSTQLIAWNFHFTGTYDGWVDFQENLLFSRATYLELYR
jgi:Flp pilus assembly protein TadG